MYRWTDGVVERVSETCPGPTFRRGRKPFTRTDTPETIRKRVETRRKKDNYTAWNKGLSKDTDPRMAQMAKTLSKSMKGCTPWNKGKGQDRTPFRQYRATVDSLTEKTYKEHKDIINPHDHPRTRMGVEGGWQIDHIISVKEGFDRGMEPEEIATLDNLQMLTWEENRKKWQ